MTIRKFHRICGLAFGPFLLLTAVTGLILLFRKSGAYSGEAKETMLALHNWELLNRVGVRYLGVLLAAGLITMVITGGLLASQTWRRKRSRSTSRG